MGTYRSLIDTIGSADGAVAAALMSVESASHFTACEQSKSWRPTLTNQGVHLDPTANKPGLRLMELPLT